MIEVARQEVAVTANDALTALYWQIHYLTELPPRKTLEERLRRAIEAAKSRLVARTDMVPPGEQPLASGSRRRRRK